jgi:hypothetical protein
MARANQNTHHTISAPLGVSWQRRLACGIRQPRTLWSAPSPSELRFDRGLHLPLPAAPWRLRKGKRTCGQAPRLLWASAVAREIPVHRHSRLRMRILVETKWGLDYLIREFRMRAVSQRLQSRRGYLSETGCRGVHPITTKIGHRALLCAFGREHTYLSATGTPREALLPAINQRKHAINSTQQRTAIYLSVRCRSAFSWSMDLRAVAKSDHA